MKIAIAGTGYVGLSMAVPSLPSQAVMVPGIADGSGLRQAQTACRAADLVLGYVGLPLAVEFGQHRSVVGFDINPVRIQELQSGHDSTLEVTAQQLRSAKQLSFSAHLEDLRESEVFIVTVPTPVDGANRPDMTPLIKASETVGRVLRTGGVVVYESTVYPGATEEVCVPVLERVSGLKFNQDFFCGYSPERINPGDKVKPLNFLQVGWMSQYGEQNPLPLQGEGQYTCPHSGQAYRLMGDQLSLVVGHA